MIKAVRAAQLADQIRDYLATWVSRDMVGFFVTVQQVTLSTDMATAVAWISVVPDEKAPAVLRVLRKRMPFYQHSLGQKLQRHLVPILKVRLIERLPDTFTLE